MFPTASIFIKYKVGERGNRGKISKDNIQEIILSTEADKKNKSSKIKGISCRLFKYSGTE